MSRETELAWAAGFYDGEGCTGYRIIKSWKGRGRPEGYGHVTLSIGQIHREPLERFQTAVGGVGHITSEHRTGKQNTLYRWTLGSNAKAAEVISQLWPYLCSIKREQAERALANHDRDIRDNPRNYYSQLRDQIVELSGQGLNPPEIAERVGRARRTVYYHLKEAKDGKSG